MYFMVRVFFAFFLSVLTTIAQVRIDASSPEKLQRSYADVIASLDVDNQEKFALAMTVIGVSLSQRSDLGGSKKIMEIINGKTAEEIIAESKKYTAYIKGTENVVKADNGSEFSQSVGKLLVSLSDTKRADFSEAIAKLMYEKEQKKTGDKEFLKMVNGKTADEIIDMAKHIQTPFLTSNKRDNLDYSIEEASSEDLKKFGIKPTKKQKTPNNVEVLDFSKSLVPSGL